MADPNPEFDLPSPEELSNLLPGYSEIEFFAQGGMAAIYKGVQTSLDRPVAIKVLPREYGGDDAFRLRFEAEGKAMAKLNHPNLVSIFDFGEVDNLLYIVMEFVPGETLFQYSYGKEIPAAAAVAFARKIADGLAHAHEVGILHRDIKPANILLDEKGEPKLGDFGLAEGEERAEGDELAFGTPGYTSPEVIADPSCADERTDIFAVGILLYELLTTKLPEEPYNPPSRLVRCSPLVDRIIQRAIQPDPAARYQSAQELAEDLQNLERKLPKRAAKAFAAPVTASGAAAEGAIPPRSTRRAPATTRVGPDFTLFRNLIIIAGLCGAIAITWTVLNHKKEVVANKQKEIDQAAVDTEAMTEERQAAFNEVNGIREEATSSPLATNNSQTSNEPAPAEPKPETIIELTPAEELAELRVALSEGNRSQFPKTTLQRADSRYFFVSKAMTWHEAANFSEDHGAHLAIPASKSDLTWLGQKMPEGVEEVWLGGRAVARTSWKWLDPAIEFTLEEPNLALGSAATATPYGILKAAQLSEELPFFMQWHSDGSTPATLQNQLARLAESRESGDPEWPPGTLALEERRYLILARELSYPEAQTMAKNQGGHLAVASSEIEASFLRDEAAESGLSPLWIGGLREEGDWSWTTGEPWNFARWAPEFPTAEISATALALNSDGWINRPPSQSTAGFIIEWSDDAEGADNEEMAEVGDAGAELNELRTLARQLINREIADYLEKVGRNTKAQGSGIRQWLRSISQEEATSYRKVYESYSSLIDKRTERLPELDSLSLGGLPAKGKELLSRHHQRQREFDLELKSAAEKLRSAYVKRIQTKIIELEAKGLKAKVAMLQKEIDGVGTSGTSFLEYFSASPFATTALKDNPLQKVIVKKAIYGSRGKHVDVTQQVQEYIETGEEFRVLVNALKVEDPDPGWNKSVQIFFSVDDKEFSPWFGRDTLISNEVLYKHAKEKMSE
jgi:tRNA A-37 threonylcarbamoyl transferase component Bud32